MIAGVLALVLAQAATAVGQPVATPAPAPTVAPVPAPVATPVPAPVPPKPLPRVALETPSGRIVIELETVRAPISAANFLRYVDQKRLDGVKFYRTVKVGDKFGFVQFGPAGDPRRNLPPIKHEPTSVTGVKHLSGTISTARLEPGTARGEFTISIGDQPSFDANPAGPADAYQTNQGYAAFGRVVEGMDVVVKIMESPIDPAKSDRGSFRGEMPAAPVTVTTARRVPG